MQIGHFIHFIDKFCIPVGWQECNNWFHITAHFKIESAVYYFSLLTRIIAEGRIFHGKTGCTPWPLLFTSFWAKGQYKQSRYGSIGNISSKHITNGNINILMAPHKYTTF